jgi:hypothetical protein
VSVGQAEEGIRRNIEQGDLVGIAKFVRYLVGTVSIYADDEPAIWAQIEAIPKFDWSKPDEEQAFEDEMKRRELCLRILRNKNIFGYLGEPPMGNSDALREALEEVEA